TNTKTPKLTEHKSAITNYPMSDEQTPKVRNRNRSETPFDFCSAVVN
ncbi:hypothetical protein GWI33_013713, partial [Rhynchophorus ferrugineus]